MKGNSKNARAPWAPQRMKVALPVVVICCAVSFFAGFFVSMSPPADSTGGIPHLMRLNKVEESGMAHGESGEDGVSALPFQILSWNPRALYFPNFSNRKQCETVVKMAKGKLKPSTLALRKGETAENTKGIRTSSGTFISSSEDPSGVIGVIEQKIARATMIPRENGEPFNVLRYEIGQRYASHYDAFNAAEYGPQKSQRVASFLLYLTDVEEGGETMFPYENGSNMNSGYDYERCIGLKVKPRQGDGLLFYSLFVNGTIDPKSLHGSCPVIKGEKWVATKWIRDQVHE